MNDEFETSNVCEMSNDINNYDLPVIYKERMHKVLMSFVGKLYAAPNLPRSHVQEIIDDVTELFQDFTSQIRPIMENTLKILKTHDEIENLLHILTAWDVSLHEVSTETRRLKLLERTGCLIYPKSYTVGGICEEKKSSGSYSKRNDIIEGTIHSNKTSSNSIFQFTRSA